MQINALFGASFQPLDRVNLKNNRRFGFGILKNIEIDVSLVPIKHLIQFYPLSEASFQSLDRVDLKNNGRFGLVIFKECNVKIDF